nr:Plug and carboxypeptidase regulatory-like domain-containing protein [Acidobacteriota bacterium]
MRKAFLIVALAMIVAIPVALAQQPTTGTLQGIVGEQDGKPLPGATVVVKGPLGERAAQTDAKGQFEFRFLPAGTYTVRAEMPGYSTVEVGGVDINAAGRTRLPITLLPGQTAEITVSSAAPLLDVKRTTVATSFKSKSLETLPIGRNFTDAVSFAPGVVSGLGTGAGNYSIGGSSGLENSYIIDGVNITDSGYGGVGTYS